MDLGQMGNSEKTSTVYTKLVGEKIGHKDVSEGKKSRALRIDLDQVCCDVFRDYRTISHGGGYH
jgi:hypothetical protein